MKGLSVAVPTLVVIGAILLLSGCGVVSCKICGRDDARWRAVSHAPTDPSVEVDAPPLWLDDQPQPVIVTVTGYGAPDDRFSNQAQRTLMAMRASEVEAYRTLAEHVRGVQVSSSTKVADFLTRYDHLRLVVDSYIYQANVISQGLTGDGYYETTLSLTLDQQFFGRLASAIVRPPLSSAAGTDSVRVNESVGQTFPRKAGATLSTTDVHYDVGVDFYKR